MFVNLYFKYLKILSAFRNKKGVIATQSQHCCMHTYACAAFFETCRNYCQMPNSVLSLGDNSYVIKKPHKCGFKNLKLVFNLRNSKLCKNFSTKNIKLSLSIIIYKILTFYTFSI